jgi:hypothetical protein
MTGNSGFRDFIYSDTMRVRSVASQLFKGLIEAQTVERLRSKQTADAADARDQSWASSESRTVEERVLLDEIYNQVEAQIRPYVIDEESDDLESLLLLPLVKVTGYAEFEDYARLRFYLDHYSELMKLVYYDEFRQAAKGKVFPSHGAYDKAITEHLDKTGSLPDPRLVANLSRFAQLLSDDSAFAVCYPSLRSPLSARAVLDRRWLRYPESMLRSLYAGSSVVQWTIVGQVTYVPASRTPKENDEYVPSMVEADVPNMGQAYRALFRSARFLEKAFSRTSGREIVMSPLVIYREFASTPSSPKGGC